MSTIEFLRTAIRGKSESENHDVPIAIDPIELSHHEMRAAGFLDEAAKPKVLTVVQNEAILPQAGLSIGSRTILIGSLAESTSPSPSNDVAREPILTRWREYQRRCAIARSWLPEDRSDDLMLFLVGPPGSCVDAHWKALTGQIERNDLVCRKLVWLPPVEMSEWLESTGTFFRRTFLARPWMGETTVTQRPLDTLADTGAMPITWQAILDQQPIERGDIDYDALVARLIEEFKP